MVKQTGHIGCEVTGSKKYWADLEHADLEIPPKMTFGRISKDMKSKLQLRFFNFLPKTRVTRLISLDTLKHFAHKIFHKFLIVKCVGHAILFALVLSG